MPDKQLWGGETAKAVENFPISGETVPVSVIHWLARVKGAAAAVNGELGLLSKTSATKIERAAREIAAGKHDAQFPIDVFQTGSGTSTNMNANEVIATLAGEKVHANDHVNMGQTPTTCSPRPCTWLRWTSPRTSCCPRSSSWSARWRARRKAFRTSSSPGART